MVDGGELELDEHHVIAQPHRQVQRRRTGQEIVHLEQEKDDLECRLCIAIFYGDSMIDDNFFLSIGKRKGK